MLQLKRRVGESVNVGTVRLTHVVVGERRGVRVEAPGHEPFTLFTGNPRSQWRFGLITEADVVRAEARRRVNRVFTPEECDDNQAR